MGDFSEKEGLQRVSPMHLSHCCCQKVGLTYSSIVAQSNDKHETTSSCTTINNILMESSPNTTEGLQRVSPMHLSHCCCQKVGLTYSSIVAQSNDKHDTTSSCTTINNILMESSPNTTGNKENSANQIQGNSPASRKRKSSRRNCCPYCKRLITNFGRHLVAVHRDEESVQEYLNIRGENLKDRAHKRAEISNKLRKEGNYMYSTSHKQSIIPTKRLSVDEPQTISNNNTHVCCK
ncbi:uncharacterized protein LOC111064388 isoform X2 [Nilaparvata lugens]|uniref:uncharacterized protein LOC111064388 isoform X2 n=1 Tax=Nilaparvata lugens TaxID=108931 RepID=UPI00193D0813|nr:uncharacterized protein LOC111064388 isoform X2 [Nilaparvata lugens]